MTFSPGVKFKPGDLTTIVDNRYAWAYNGRVPLFIFEEGSFILVISEKDYPSKIWEDTMLVLYNGHLVEVFVDSLRILE